MIGNFGFGHQFPKCLGLRDERGEDDDVGAALWPKIPGEGHILWVNAVKAFDLVNMNGENLRNVMEKFSMWTILIRCSSIYLSFFLILKLYSFYNLF